jgi:hypothetical protein
VAWGNSKYGGTKAFNNSSSKDKNYTEIYSNGYDRTISFKGGKGTISGINLDIAITSRRPFASIVFIPPSYDRTISFKSSKGVTI